jgi:TonB family protein
MKVLFSYVLMIAATPGCCLAVDSMVNEGATVSGLPLPLSHQRLPAACEPPRWPKSSIRFSEAPRVVLEFRVNMEGKVISGKVVETSGAKLFDRTALAALMKCLYTPVKVRGRDDVARVRVRYSWPLE